MKATYIITWREGGDADRRANLVAVLAWLARTPDLEVIVVEQDSVPRLDGELPDPRTQRIFAYNPGPFNKGWGFNVGLRHASTNVFAFGDADVIVDGVLETAIAHCAQSMPAVKPYRRIVDLTPDETSLVRGGDFAFAPQRDERSGRNREGRGEYVVFCGGLFLIRAEALRHIGVWDERFVGWGGEDDAMTYRLERARVGAMELDEGPALHLHHARPAQATFGQPAYAGNRALLDDYRNYGDAQLRRLGDVLRQIGGNRDKYRPQTL